MLVYLITFAFVLLVSLPQSHSNPLSNKVPKFNSTSTTVEINFIDLSKSVDQQTVLTGVNSLRKKIARAYNTSSGKYDSKAKSYYYWFKMRGTQDRKGFSVLFDRRIDEGLWEAIRSSGTGKTNQLKVLERIRQIDGLWYRMVLSRSLKNCLQGLSRELRPGIPGLFGSALTRVLVGVCNKAIETNNNLILMEKEVSAYLSGELSSRGGSDLLGAIDYLDDQIGDKYGLSQYKRVRLVFVSDGIHRTPLLDLKDVLLNSERDACQIGKVEGEKDSKLSANKFEVQMYGIGEKRSGSNLVSESLKEPLKKFWECFWKAKGLDPRFNELSDWGND